MHCNGLCKKIAVTNTLLTKQKKLRSGKWQKSLETIVFQGFSLVRVVIQYFLKNIVVQFVFETIG